MNNCSICLNEDIEDNLMCKIECEHSFCKNCLDTWLNRGNDNCPYVDKKLNLLNIEMKNIV